MSKKLLLIDFLNAYCDLWQERLDRATPEHRDMVRFGCEMVMDDMEGFKRIVGGQ